MILFTIYLLAASASFNGFYDKWGLRDDASRFNPTQIFAGTADRPFVYRRLDPWLVDGLAALAPSAVATRLESIANDHSGHSRLGPDKLLTSSPDYFLKYHMLYYLSFLELFVSLFMLRSLCLSFTGEYGAVAAPVVFALILPIFLTRGGYFYDMGEICLLSAATLCAVRKLVIPLVLIVLFGTLNKESFLFFIPSLTPFLYDRSNLKSTLVLVSALLFSSAISYSFVHFMYQRNSGATAEFWLADNIRFYINPVHLLIPEKTYGLSLPRAYGIFWIVFVLGTACLGWQSVSIRLKLHALIILAINLPLFLICAAPGEMRNLSLTFVGWTVLLASALQGGMQRTLSSSAVAPLNGEA